MCIAPSANCFANLFYTSRKGPLGTRVTPDQWSLSLCLMGLGLASSQLTEKLDKIRIVKNINSLGIYF